MTGKVEIPIPRIRGILFDLDGVLINSEPLHESTLLQLSTRFGKRFDHAQLQQCKGLPELPMAKMFQSLFPKLTLTTNEITRARIELVESNYDRVEMIEGALLFMKKAQRAGLQLGLTTSAARSLQQRACDRFELGPFFDAIITGEDIERGKPDPEPYLLTAARLQLPPTECMVVEDAVNGVLSGKAAGGFVVGLTTSFSVELLEKAGADLVVPSFAVLENALFSSARSSLDIA